MKLHFFILFNIIVSLTIGQTNNNVVFLNDRSTKTSADYFDINDPFFLIFFVNAQKQNNKIKVFKEQIKKSEYYRKIDSYDLDFFIDSIRNAVFKDTGLICLTKRVSIKKTNIYLPVSNYIFWVDNKYWYKVGDNGKNTLEFVNEFLVQNKVKSAAMVSPPPETNFKCIGKTIAHIYLSTNRHYHFNYAIAKMKFKQLKLGKRWVGHN